MASPNKADRPVTLVGAGLVGSLLSLYLARRGYQVEVLERRGDMRKESLSAGRSINLAISERGLFALRQLGLEAEARAHAIPMKGRMMHPKRGELAFQSYGKDDSQFINSISRGWLNRMLMDHAEQTGKVALHFHQRVTSVDFDAATLEVKDELTGALRTEKAEVLIGTDGSASPLRQAMSRRPGATCSEEILQHGYKELEIPAGAGGSFQMEKHALHIWPRGQFMLIALPNEDGSFTCTLFLPFQGSASFAALETPAAVRSFFEAEFPDTVPLIPRLEEDFFAHPTGNMLTVKCAPWNVGGRALILGDAAHAIVPFYGQGMNCGFEDCVALDRLIERHPGWAERFEAFSGSRKTHSDAIAEMAIENFAEMRDKVGDPRFLLEKQIEKKLLNAFPGQFVSRYALVSFSLAPYRVAYRVGEIAGGILRELSEGITDAEDVDLPRAAQLIQGRLAPYLKDNHHGFSAS